MKYCPICLVSYSTDTSTCRHDGALLVESRDWKPGLIVRSKYRIVDKIGRGGMGTVYKAEHIALQELRALKVLDPFLGDDPRFIRRFHVEAKTARRVRHPGIVHVEDLDQAEDGSLFIAMEYVDGPSLKVILANQGGPLPIKRALSLARQVAEALDAAHVLGIVHRDIKPDNILIATDAAGRDVVKIVDLGIAALREHSHTVSTGLLMTPAYAAPEQWRRMRAADLDGRADLYSLGATMFEMLTGQKPFRAETAEQWMHAHLQEQPPTPSVVHPPLSALPGLDRLVLTLLAKDRNERPSTAAEVITRLDSILAMLAPDWRPPWPERVGPEEEETVLGAGGSRAEAPKDAPVQAGPWESADQDTGRRPWLRIAAVVTAGLVLLTSGVLVAPRVKRWWQERTAATDQERTVKETATESPTGGQPPSSERGGQAAGAVSSPGTPGQPGAGVSSASSSPSGQPGSSSGAAVGADLERRFVDLLTLGRAAFERGDYDTATRQLGAALELRKGDAAAVEALGRVQAAARAEDEVLRRMKSAGVR